MTQYSVSGMSCAACAARVEKAVTGVEGVTACAVNLLTNSMGVEGTASPEKIIEAVRGAGYGAALKESKKSPSTSDNDVLKDTETPKLKKRLIASLAFLIILMYISMGHMMWGWPLPSFLADNHIAMGLLQLLLTAIIMVINQKFFISGFKGLLHRSPNMDTLVALGAGAAFIYSTYALFAMTDAQLKGDASAVMSYMHEFYFESAAMILTLITVGKMLEARSKGKTTDALKGLMNLAPKTAVVITDGVETEVPVENIQKGNIFVVRPGGSIPVDGIILEGATAVDESALTGESIPADKTVGDKVSAATINQSGYIKCEATRVGEDTTLSQIIKTVSDAAATKAPIAKAADRVSGVFVPVVTVIAVMTVVVWLLVGQGFGFALARGISVLVISCPCALGLATPVAIMVGNGVGAKNGILFKTAESLEQTGKAQIAVLDKTGTITMGKPEVTDIIPAEGITENELLTAAFSLEFQSEHPLARAITEKGEEMGIKRFPVTDFEALPGNGLYAKLENDEIYGGSLKFIKEKAKVPSIIHENAEDKANEGKTPLLFCKNGKLLGVIAVADVIKEDSPKAIKELQNMGLRVVMLTGDNEKTARAIGRAAGVDKVIAGVLPDGKEKVIRQLKQQGKVIMVGDGINDAPALTSADMGFAIGAGTDIAIDAADVVLMNSRLSDVPAAVRLSRAALRNIHGNLFWAFFYNVVGIPLAAGALIPVFGRQLNPMFAAAAMSLSSVCVVTNALRLNFFDIRNGKKDKKIKSQKVKESKTMEKTVKIEGMMCSHCEATVKKMFEEFPQVDEAIVSHTEGTAVLKLNADLPDDMIKKAVEDKGYTVTE
ncbi:MAG: heavy metal translocating P-type ATPase [Candidatus Fimenecus sp.]